MEISPFTNLSLSAILFFAIPISLGQLFTKAGRPGWQAFVPFYNIWVLCEIIGWPGAYAIAYIALSILTSSTLVCMFFYMVSALTPVGGQPPISNEFASFMSAFFSPVGLFGAFALGIIFIGLSMVGLHRTAKVFGRNNTFATFFALSQIVQIVGLASWLMLAFSPKTKYSLKSKSADKTSGTVIVPPQNASDSTPKNNDPWIEGREQ